MTTSELYAVYCQAYAEYDPGLAGAGLPGASLAAGRGSAIQRAIAEFAAEDAANGAPLRSREQFAHAVEAGLEALRPLGLRAA